jgi:hypothetical protein
MTDDDNDKTEEVREQLGEDGAVGGETDSDSGAVLTLDAESADSGANSSGDESDTLDGADTTSDGAGEGERDERGDDGGN